MRSAPPPRRSRCSSFRTSSPSGVPSGRSLIQCLPQETFPCTPGARDRGKIGPGFCNDAVRILWAEPLMIQLGPLRRSPSLPIHPKRCVPWAHYSRGSRTLAWTNNSQHGRCRTGCHIQHRRTAVPAEWQTPSTCSTTNLKIKVLMLAIGKGVFSSMQSFGSSEQRVPMTILLKCQFRAVNFMIHACFMMGS